MAEPPLNWGQATKGLKDMQNRVPILDAAYDELLKEIADPNKSEQAKRFAQLHLRLNREEKDKLLRDTSQMLGLRPPPPPTGIGGRKNRSKTKRNNKRIKSIRNKYNKRTKNRRYKSKK